MSSVIIISRSRCVASSVSLQSALIWQQTPLIPFKSQLCVNSAEGFNEYFLQLPRFLFLRRHGVYLDSQKHRQPRKSDGRAARYRLRRDAARAECGTHKRPGDRLAAAVMA